MSANILQILDQFGITIEKQKLNSSGTELTGTCPFHTIVAGHSEHSFNMNVETGLWRCWSCHAKGNLHQFIEKHTGLTHDEIANGINGQALPSFQVIKPKADRLRYLTDQELDILTNYCNGLSGLMMGKRQGVDSGPWLDYLRSRGFDNDTIAYFKLGANAMKGYGEYFINEISKIDKKAAHTLKGLKLINDKGDYWWKPSVIIPYYSSGQCYFANARILPKYADGMKYMMMSGISRTCFFNDDALDQDYDNLFIVEGEFNAMAMWQAGFKNVVSFGGKQAFNDSLISTLYGRDVTLYFDTDKSDPEFMAREAVIEKLSDTAKSVSYFELPEGTDINDYLRDHGRQEFEDCILSKSLTVNDADEFLPSEYRILPESERDEIVTLADMQVKNSEFFSNIADNFKNYAGKMMLNNSPVGTGKTTGAISLVNSRKEKTLILTSTHYEADVYELEQNLDFDCFTVHLKGRSHVDIRCPYADIAESLSRLGYAMKFKLDYCWGTCSKPYELDEEGESGTCLHMNLQEAAKHAGVLITVHAHAGLKDFFISPYYGNKRRSLIIIDEQCDLTKKVYFDRKTITYNIGLLDRIATMDVSDEVKAAAKELWCIENLMLWRLNFRETFRTGVRHFSNQEIYEIDKAICKQKVSEVLPNILYDLIYALENDPDKDGCIELKYDLDPERLFYVWRAKLPEKACVVFMSATTSKKYLEQVLGVKVDEVFGEQFNLRRENLKIIQLLNVVGGRGRVLKDEKLQEYIKEFFKAVLDKHKDNRIMLITSLGGNIENARTEGSAKQRVINLLEPIAKSFNRRLVGVGTKDIEDGNIPDSFCEIPVIHYGIQGTNIFADYDILIEINAHYYRNDTIEDGAETAFDIEIKKEKQEKKQVTFRTQDKEYTIDKYIHPDPLVTTYIENTQEGEMMQAEGRILRGEDTSKTIYRLHSVNIKPYPTVVYKSWQSLMANEFGIKKDQTTIKGKLKQVLDWIQDNKLVNQTFSTKEIIKALGGYGHDMNRRYLKKLQEQGYITNLLAGGGQGSDSVWERKL